MTSSELYHGFGLQGYRTRASHFESGKIIFVIESTKPPRCSSCNSRDVVCRGQISRDFLGLCIGLKKVFFRLAIQRVGCRLCGRVRQVNVDFAPSRRSYTKRVERFVLCLLRFATIKDVAYITGLGWDVVKDILKRSLQQRFRRPCLKGVRRIAVDEIAIGKGHRYLTVVLDLDSCRVLFVGDGKGADALKPFWKRVCRCKQCKIRAVAIDMSPAYISAVQKNLPAVKMVFDHFHITQLCNKMLGNLRKALYRKATEEQKKVLKGTRWLLLKNQENLDPKRREKQRLQVALDLNEPLFVAYYLKEELRQFWQCDNKAQAERFLLDWCARAESAGIQHLKRFAQTIAGHRTGLLAWYDEPISTGPLEGINNKIKTMKRQAYGYRDIEFFKLKIKALHETKYALVG